MKKEKWFLCLVAMLFQTVLWAIGGYDIERLSAKDGLEEGEIVKILQDEQGYMWIATDKGIYRYDGYWLRKIESDRKNSQDVVCLTEDKKNGVLWILYKQGGTDCLDLKKHCFIEFDQGGDSGKFARQYVGKLYLWQYGDGEKCRRVRFVGGKIHKEEFSKKVNDICSDQAGNDWILTNDGVYLNGFERMLPHSDNVRHIAVYRNICLAIASDRIIIYNVSRRVVRETLFPANLLADLSNCSDKSVWNEQLLLFSSGRTYAYHIIDGIFTSPEEWQAPDGSVFSEHEGDVMVEDERGEWLCYRSNGEVKRLKSDEVRKKERYSPLYAKVNADIEAIAVHNGGLWIYDVEQNELDKCSMIQKEDSITAMVSDRTGCVWIGGKRDGVLCLRISQEHTKNSESSSVSVVTDIIYGNQHFTPDRKPLKLEGKHRKLTLHFSNFQYADIRSVRYQYYLEGIENEWSEITSGHTAVYHNLSPGMYVFHVRSADSSDYWGEVSSYTFVIEYPWWNQWFVHVLCILVVGGISGVFLYKRKYKGKHSGAEREFEEQTEKEKKLKDADEKSLLNPKDQRFYNRLQAILSLNAENPEFTVDELAVQMHLSRTRLYTRIKEVTGKSPSEILKKVRMEYAAHLLLETDLTIEEIRLQCGVGNSNQFYNHFKKQFGVTPHQYRTKV